MNRRNFIGGLGRSGVTENRHNYTDILSVDKAISIALERVKETVALFSPVYISAGLSGGHDSLTATYIASLVPEFKTALHIDTGVGLKATRDFIDYVCLEMGWKLEVYSAKGYKRSNGSPDPQDYFAMIEERGFPGPGMHWKMYQRLKQRAIMHFCREHKAFRSRQLVMIVSGRRRQESKRRESKVLGPHEREERILWSNPIWDFSKLDCLRIMEYARIPRSPVVDLIHKSGECLCGCFGSAQELAETAMWFPDDPVIKRLLELNPKLRHKFGWGWGERQDTKCSKSGAMCNNCELLPLFP